MVENGVPAPCAGRITLYLLDPVKGSPIQTWEFESRPVVRVGRAPENDVVVQDPQVSRVHAELQFVDDRWQLINRGRNGTQVAGANVETMAIPPETCFRLGPEGPSFRFSNSRRALDESATVLNLRIDMPAPSIHIDEDKKTRDVEDIVESDYFRQIKLASRQLKKRATQDTDTP